MPTTIATRATAPTIMPITAPADRSSPDLGVGGGRGPEKIIHNFSFSFTDCL